MVESNEAAPPVAGAPSDVLMALYTNDRDRAKSLAIGRVHRDTKPFRRIVVTE